MANEYITKEQLDGALGAICDTISAADMSEKIKGNAGFTVTALMCDAAGNTLFSYDTVMKYAKDEYGIEKITVEVAGKAVGDFVFDQGMKQTVKMALATTVSTALGDSPLSAPIAGVGVFTTGYALTKTAQTGAESLTKKLLTEILIGDENKIDSSDTSNKDMVLFDKETNTLTISDTNTAKELLPTLIDKTNVQNLTIGSETYTIKSGDSLYSIAQKAGVSVDELLQANPWLEEQGRVNEDKSYVLIKAGETINIKRDNNTYSYDLENSSVSIKDEANNPLALDSISNDILKNISAGFTTLNTQTKTLDLNSIKTIDGGYGDIVNVKDTLGNDVFIVPDEYGNVSVYDNNGQLDVLQASSIINVLNSKNLNNYSDVQQNLFNWNNNGLLGNDLYSNLSQNITNYLVNTTSVYTPLVNNYFTPINIGAFYESSTSQIDNSESIAKKTYRILNSSNQTITKNQLNALDVNKDGQLSGNEISTLKTWKDLNEDGIA